MIFNKHVFLVVVVAVYTAAFIATFDELYDSVQISSIALIGLCGWFYGTRIGLFSIVPFVLLNTAILYLVSGKTHDILLTYNPVGIIISMMVVLAIGSMRDSQNKLNELRDSLASRIDDATTELEELVQQLIKNDEKECIRIGQDLHDGVGQYLTGMLLHSEALSLNLKEAKRVEAGLSEKMVQRIQKTIHTIRRLSRSLLPIEFTATNLENATDEMAAYFSDVSGVNFQLKYVGDSVDIPIPIAQHLHRIIHETIYQFIYKHKVTHIEVQLSTENQRVRFKIKGKGMPQQAAPVSDLVSKIIKYRAKTIGAELEIFTPSSDAFRLECSVGFRKEIK